MSDTVEVRYVGPLTDGISLQPVIGSHAGQEYVCLHGEWAALPADLVNGTAHIYDLDYTVPENPADIDSDQIVEYGVEPLTNQEYVDANGDRQPCWETRAPKASKLRPSAAPKTEED